MDVFLFKADLPLANIFAQSDFFPLSFVFRPKPSGTNIGLRQKKKVASRENIR